MRNISFKNTSVDNSSGESVGTALTVTVVVGSVLLLLAAMVGPSPVRAEPTVAQIAKPAIEQIVVTATRPGRVS